MGKRLIQLIFFGNYFVGILGIALSLETSVQLRLPFNSIAYYLLLFCATVMYYTYAYIGVLQSSSTDNLRASWYARHRTFTRYSQWFFLTMCVMLAGVMLARDRSDDALACVVLADSGVILLSCVLYYGLLPRSVFKLNLRNTGWLKAFVIGFVWAGCVSLLPIVVLQVENTVYTVDPLLMIVLFIKNWMFCTVNAIHV
jgi:hypothetical protein